MDFDESPFVKGNYYRVIADISELGHCFNKGEIVEYIDESYDPKLGLFRFWFKDTKSNEIKALHIWEERNDLINVVQMHFELIDRQNQ